MSEPISEQELADCIRRMADSMEAIALNLADIESIVIKLDDISEILQKIF
jgi:hypothetical protein